MSIKGVPFGLKLRHFSFCLQCPGPRSSRCREPKRRQWSRKKKRLILPSVSKTEVKSLSRDWAFDPLRAVIKNGQVVTQDSYQAPSQRIQQKGAALSLY